MVVAACKGLLALAVYIQSENAVAMAVTIVLAAQFLVVLATAWSFAAGAALQSTKIQVLTPLGRACESLSAIAIALILGGPMIEICYQVLALLNCPPDPVASQELEDQENYKSCKFLKL